MLPPSIGLGDAVEYASALKEISQNGNYEKIGVGFTEEYTFVFKDFFKLQNTYAYVILESEIQKYDIVFHLTYEIKSLANQKYLRSNIFEEIVNYFKIKNIQNKKKERRKIKNINKISIFPISSSPIRTMPLLLLIELIKILKKNYIIEIFLDRNSNISNLISNNLNFESFSFVDPLNKLELFSQVKNIEYGIFMDSAFACSKNLQ